MESKYRCNVCGLVFREPETMNADIFYGVDFDYASKEIIYMCPKCKETNFKEIEYEENFKENDEDGVTRL